jgi:putative endonuclease
MKSLEQKRLYDRRGRQAETLAALYFRCRGYRILAKRYKTRLGEIDLIAARGELIIIAEVKHRQTLGQAHESLSAASEQRIRNAADLFIARDRRAQAKGVRFDALFFYGPRPSLRRVQHIISAF